MTVDECMRAAPRLVTSAINYPCYLQVSRVQKLLVMQGQCNVTHNIRRHQ